MTQQGESAPADGTPVAPPTRRSRREAERTAQLHAIIAQSAVSSAVRVVDGAAPIYRTRRAMREAAAQRAHDLPVVVAASSAETAPVEATGAPEVAAAKVDAEAPAATPVLPVSTPRPATESVAVAAPMAVSVVPSPALENAAPAAAAGSVTRAQRRAEAAAASAEVTAAVTAVLGEARVDDASVPVRTPLRCDARGPKPVTVVARRPILQTPHAPVGRRARSAAARRVMQRFAAGGVLLSIGALVAVTSLPAQAFSPEVGSGQEQVAAYGDVDVQQQMEVGSGHGDAGVTAFLGRDDFGVDDAVASTTFDPEELSALQAVADAEPVGNYYGGEPAMPQVWQQLETSYTQSPFPSLDQVPVSSGFGYRWGSFHGGVDLIPGAGTPIYPIANGVVVALWQGNNPGGGGYQVIVEHNINGQYFQSWYPHMQAGSIQVQVGQVVDINTQIGAVGSTGRSTGAHLHLEIKNSDYISVDPLVWLSTREEILEPS